MYVYEGTGYCLMIDDEEMEDDVIATYNELTGAEVADLYEIDDMMSTSTDAIILQASGCSSCVMDMMVSRRCGTCCWNSGKIRICSVETSR